MMALRAQILTCRGTWAVAFGDTLLAALAFATLTAASLRSTRLPLLRRWPLAAETKDVVQRNVDGYPRGDRPSTYCRGMPCST